MPHRTNYFDMKRNLLYNEEYKNIHGLKAICISSSFKELIALVFLLLYIVNSLPRLKYPPKISLFTLNCSNLIHRSQYFIYIETLENWTEKSKQTA